MRKTLQKSLVMVAPIAILSLSVTAAHAGSEVGVITELHARNDGLVAFELSGTHADRPACATHEYWIIQNENSAFGQRQFALLQQAYLSGRPVSVIGLGACPRWGDGEDVYNIMLTR